MVRYRSIFIISLLCVPLLAVACKGKPADDEASIKKTLEEKGTIDVMDQVSKAPDYHPPADGHLTDGQVKLFLAVRQREQKIREVAFKNLQAKSDQAKQENKQEKRDVGVFEAMKALGDVADVATADLRAAQELGHNPKEYQWIKERVLEVELLETTKVLLESQESLVKMLEKQKTLLADEAQKAEIDKQIREIRDSAGEESTPAKEFNARLLAKYKDDFEKLEAEDTRIAQAQSKGSQNDSR